MKLWLVGAGLMVWMAFYGVFNGLSLIGLGIMAYAIFRRFREERADV
jgi:hypothetical protein